jgi:hypothetical protein
MVSNFPYRDRRQLWLGDRGIHWPLIRDEKRERYERMRRIAVARLHREARKQRSWWERLLGAIKMAVVNAKALTPEELAAKLKANPSFREVGKPGEGIVIVGALRSPGSIGAPSVPLKDDRS